MAHSVLVTLHAAGGLLALLLGALSIRRPAAITGYVWAVNACIAFLAAVIGADWTDLDTSERGVFTAFLALGGYLVWAATAARRCLAAGDTPHYLDHLGFTLVALIDAAIVVTVLDLGAPTWLVVAVGVVLAGAGHLAIRATKKRMLAPT